MWTFINTKKANKKRLRVLFAFLVLKGLKGSNDYVHHPRCNNRPAAIPFKKRRQESFQKLRPP